MLTRRDNDQIGQARTLERMGDLYAEESQLEPATSRWIEALKIREALHHADFVGVDPYGKAEIADGRQYNDKQEEPENAKAARHSLLEPILIAAQDFFVVNGGCAANAAVAIARLGGRAALAGPIGGPAGADASGDRVLAALAHEQVDCSGCERIAGVATALSAIFIDARGERMIVRMRSATLLRETSVPLKGLPFSVVS